MKKALKESRTKIRWIKTADMAPPTDREVMTFMKHGIISGTYDAATGMFCGYYWRDMEWDAPYWADMPVTVR